MSLLSVDDLSVRFHEGGAHALRSVSLSLEAGETLAIVGETGAGKSTLGLALTGLVQPPDAEGSVQLDGQELVGASKDTLRALRWRKVAIALQGAPFNPVLTVGEQLAEPVRSGAGVSRTAAHARALEVAREMRLDPVLLERHPHQLSGGQRSRAALAMALVLDPALLILDEPTQGLDTATSAEVVDAIANSVAKRGSALIVITHDLSAASRLGARTVVLYAGAVIERGDSALVLGEPTHPYTYALVNAYPVMTTTKDLRPIRGRPPDSRAIPSGCAFHPRCTQALDICRREVPPLQLSRGRELACHPGGILTLLQARGLGKRYHEDGSTVAALHDASIAIHEGESVGVVGPSGSGKTTLARILTGHLAADAGEVILEGSPVDVGGHRGRRPRAIQLVMQDPWDALSPRLTVAELVREPLDIEHELSGEERAARAARALESVGLPSSGTFLQSRSHQLSGGQLQRVALARALVIGPKLLVADEPTSMLDPSEQARLLVVLRERQVEMGLGLLLISHDMALVRKVCDRIVVIDSGRIAEDGPSNLVSTSPASIAGRRLMQSAPGLAPGRVTGGRTDGPTAQDADRPEAVPPIQRGDRHGAGGSGLRGSHDPDAVEAPHAATDGGERGVRLPDSVRLHRDPGVSAHDPDV